MQDFRRLRVWHAAHELSVNITNSFPVRYDTRAPGLRGQIVRSAQSIPSNIAEGCGKNTQGELLHYVEISIASANELMGHLLYARDTTQLAESSHVWMSDRLEAVRKMLFALRARLQHAHALELDKRRSTPRPARKKRARNHTIRKADERGRIPDEPERPSDER